MVMKLDLKDLNVLFIIILNIFENMMQSGKMSLKLGKNNNNNIFKFLYSCIRHF